MNRRGFFTRTIGAVVAAAIAPKAIEYAENTTPPYSHWCGEIDKATFKFWRNEQPTNAVYWLSADGPMRLGKADTY